MSDAILIQPQRTELAEGVLALEIRLGGTQRGLVIVLSDDQTPEVEVIEAMNAFAGEGFESLAMVTGDGVEALADARARAYGWWPEQIGVVGIGAGATLALDLARRRRLGAVVSLSPVPDLVDVSASPRLLTPWLGLFGAEAEDLSARDAARLRDVLDRGSDVYSQVVVYPGVGADFHRRTEDGVSFAASYDGWQRTTEWLLARVASRLTPLAQAWRDRHPVAD
jgi:dienelactone hydrolase